MNDIILPPIEIPKTKFYLYYNSQGNLTGLYNYKKDNESYIEVDEGFYSNFIETGKELSNYKIELTSNSSYIKKNDTKKHGHLLIIDRLISDPDILITVKKKSLLFTIQPVAFINKMNTNTKVVFYIVDKNNLNYLKNTIVCSIEQIIQGFEYKYSFDKNNEYLVTRKTFEKYGIIYE
jgi:hypothetical protein